MNVKQMKNRTPEKEHYKSFEENKNIPVIVVITNSSFFSSCGKRIIFSLKSYLKTFF